MLNANHHSRHQLPSKGDLSISTLVSLEEQRIADYRPKLVKFLRSKITDQSRAEDIAQDAIITTIEKLRADNIRNIEQLEAYLKKTAYYIYIGWLRKKTNQIELRDDIETFRGNEEDPCTNLMKEQLWGTVSLEIRTMPVARDREILSRFYLYEHDKQQICVELELSDSAFDRIISRARNRLKTQDFVQAELT